MPSSASSNSASRGLTLLELLLVIALAAGMLGAGVPALRHVVLEARMTATVNAMAGDLHLGRQLAQLRGRTVMVCPREPGAVCKRDGDWQTGWSVLTPASGPEAPQRHRESRPGTGVRLQSNRTAFAFRPFRRRDTNGTIGFCDERGDDAVRALVISPTGRVRLASSAEAKKRIKC
jgi:type IV fimbrial biogenesis protein FimT